MKNFSSLQSIHEKRRSDLFVGREKEISDFAFNLNLPEDDRQFIWNIYGQGGIGKTTLLKRFQFMAIEKGGCSAITDESQTSLIDSIGTIAKQIEKSGKSLRKRLKTSKNRGGRANLQDDQIQATLPDRVE